MDKIVPYYPRKPIISDAIHYGLPAAAVIGDMLESSTVGEATKVALLGLLMIALQNRAGDLLKRTFPKQRPDGQLGAFPSGHAAICAVVVAKLVAEMGALNPWTLVAIVGTVITCADRYTFRRHDVMDLLGGLGYGAVIGLAWAYLNSI